MCNVFIFPVIYYIMHYWQPPAARHSASDPGQNDFLIVLILQSTLYMSSDFSNNGGSKMFSCMRFMVGKLGTSNGIFVT